MVTKSFKILIFLFVGAIYFAPFFARAEIAGSEIVVKLNDEVVDMQSGDNDAQQIADDNKLEKTDEIPQENIAVLKITDQNQTLENKIEKLFEDPRVEYAQPNYVYHTMATSIDPYFENQWALNNSNDADMDAPEAWNISEGNNSSAIVALIDSGVMYTHPDLSPNMWNGVNCKDENGDSLGGCLYGYNFQSESKDPMATENFHGTLLAGIIAAPKNNGIGIAGIAPHAKIMALKFNLTDPGAFTTADAIRGINFAKNNGAKIINASWGGDESDILLKNAIDSFDGLFVTAAGNGGGDGIGDNNESTPMYPCSYDSPNLICVAATDSSDSLSSFSNYGSASVDVAAPGENVLGTYSDTDKSEMYAYGNGTSVSTAYVSGLAALLLGYDSSLTTAQLKSIILNTGDSISSLSGKTLAGKRINAYNALSGGLGAVAAIDPFASTEVSFDSSVKKGKTSKTSVTLKFKNIENAAQFMVSRRSDFSGGVWQTIQSSKKINIGKTSKSKTYYVKFRDSNAIESNIFIKKVKYQKKSSSKPSIKNSPAKVHRNETIIQSGKNFSKKSQVALYFSSKPMVVQTNSKGSFSVSYTVRKSAGTYSWYAVDLKTGKKTKAAAYKVL